MLTAASVTSHAASVCGNRKVTATGNSSGMTFFARASSKAAWIRKVSRESRLGPLYAQWLRAKERRTVCRKLDGRYICLAVALPCRSNKVVAMPQPRSSPQTAAKIRPL
jgi:hypothetical protein